MGKYGEALGLWELTINNKMFVLKPKKGDNYALLKIISAAEKHKDTEKTLKEFHTYIKDIFKRDVPPINDEEAEELELFVEFNINDLFKETLIAFKWTTREKLKELEAKQLGDLKNLLGNSANKQA